MDECLAIDVANSIRSERVIDVLARLVTVHGAPSFVRSDNGTVFVAQAIQDWLKEEGIESTCIAPGKPWQNGLNESFNGKFRDECLDMEWFRTRRVSSSSSNSTASSTTTFDRTAASDTGRSKSSRSC